MSMLYSIRRVLLHFRKHIAYDSWIIIGRFFGARDINCDVGELRPGEGMVEVVFHKVAVEQGNVLASPFTHNNGV